MKRAIILPLLLIATAAAGQINDTYIIPAAANAPGANNTKWATQLSLFNPQTYALKVSVTYVPTGGGQGMEKIVNLPANAVAFSDNILTDLFQRQGTGALLVATGGLAPLIANVSKRVEIVDEQLTLDGLRIIYQRNQT